MTTPTTPTSRVAIAIPVFNEATSLPAMCARHDPTVAVRRSRKDSSVRRFGFDASHLAFGVVTNLKLTSNTGTFGLLSKPALNVFDQLCEHHRFLPGLRALVGFKQAKVFHDRERSAAVTPWQTLRRLVRYALDGMFSFSYLPLPHVTRR